jgi:hypothetical protein
MKTNSPKKLLKWLLVLFPITIRECTTKNVKQNVHNMGHRSRSLLGSFFIYKKESRLLLVQLT